MGKWGWILLGGGVLWYFTQREKESIKIAANKGLTSATGAVGRGLTNVIDESFSALGRFLGGLGSSSGSSSTTTSATGSSSSSAYTPDVWNNDFYVGDG